MAPKPDLKAEGKDLSKLITDVRKRPHNFAMLIGKNGLVIEVDKKKSAEMMRKAAKNAGGGRGTWGVMSIESKVIVLDCLVEPPGNLLQAAKKHFAERGNPMRFDFRMPEEPVEEVKEETPKKAPKSKAAPEPEVEEVDDEEDAPEDISKIINNARKRPYNFACLLGKEEPVLVVHRRKPASILIKQAKSEGASARGGWGTLRVEGKVVVLTCEEDPPGTLARGLKLYMRKRGTNMGVKIVSPAGETTEPEEDVEVASQAPSSQEEPSAEPVQADNVVDPSADLLAEFEAQKARLGDNPPAGPAKKFTQLEAALNAAIGATDFGKAGKIVLMAKKLGSTLPDIQTQPLSPEALTAECKMVSKVVEALPDSSRASIESKLISCIEMLNNDDLAGASKAMKTLQDDVIAAALPSESMPEAQRSAIEAIDPRLLDSQITASGISEWNRDKLDAAIEAMREAALAMDAAATPMFDLEDNLTVLETELVRRFDAEDALLSTSLTEDELSIMALPDLQDALDTLRTAGDPDDAGQKANAERIQQELATRASVDAADDILADAQAIDIDKALTSSFAPMVDMLKALTELPDLPDTMRADIEFEISRLGNAVAERQARADKIQTGLKLPKIEVDDPQLATLLDLMEMMPGFNQLDTIADIQQAQQGFSEGVLKGYLAEVPMAGIDHPPVENWGAFYIAYNIGIFKGLGKGIADLADMVVMLGQVAGKLAPYLTNPLKLPAEVAEQGAKEVAEYFKDRDAYVEKREKQVEQVVKIANAINALEQEFDTNAFGVGSQVGAALGKVMAAFEAEFAGKSDEERGEMLGIVVGMIALEVILEVLLALASGGMANAARASLATAQVATKGAKFANHLRKVVRNVPMVKNFMKALGKVDDVADLGKASKLDELKEMVEQLKKKFGGNKPDRKKKPGTDGKGKDTDAGGGGGKDGNGGGRDGDGNGGGKDGDGDGNGGGKDGDDIPPKPDPNELAKKIDDMPADKVAVKEISKALDEAEDITQVAKAASRKLDEIGKQADELQKLADPGAHKRKPPTTEPNKTKWEQQAKALSEAKSETELLRIQVKKKLANPDGMTPEALKELTDMKKTLDENLLKLFDIEPGHAPVNHVNVTDKGLMDRVGRKIDPRFENFKSGSPAKATRFKDPSDFLDAAEAVKVYPDDLGKMHPKVRTEFEAAIANGEDRIALDMPLEDMVGPDFADKIDGFWRAGSATPPVEASKLPASAFSGDATVVYKKIGDKWELITMYPNVKGPDVLTRPANGAGEKIYDAVADAWIDKP